VDDEKSILDTLITQLETYFGDSVDFEAASGGEEAIELVIDLLDEGVPIAVVITDHQMEGMMGDQLLVEIHKMAPLSNKILLTGQADAQSVALAVNHANLYRYISKPWDKTDLQLTIEEALRSFLQQVKINQQNAVLESLYYASTVLARQTSMAQLLPLLMDIVLDNTPADYGSIILYTEQEPSQALTNLPACIAASNLPHQRYVDAEPFDCTSTTILLFCQANKQRLIVDNCRAAPWDRDPYIVEHKPKSIVCYPFMLDEVLHAMVYLESQKHIEAFDKPTIEFLQLFSVNAAISIAKAELYDSLERKVEQRTEVISSQIEIIENKNRDITDSIQYAGRIQDAILPDLSILKKYFHDSGILYMPKDIVSGDFYWFMEQQSYFYFAVADCTGHGVPGAILSVFGSNSLHYIAGQAEINEPGRILFELNNQFIDRITHKSNYRSYDGMDLSLCRYDFKKHELVFCAANRTLYLMRNGTLSEHKGTRGAIGGFTQPNHHFEETRIPIEPGDLIFIFTDGVTDQFGTEKHIKFLPRRLRNFLISHKNLPVESIIKVLKAELLEWRGQHDQTDDILLLGIRF
jgi:histidine kinase